MDLEKTYCKYLLDRVRAKEDDEWEIVDIETEYDANYEETGNAVLKHANGEFISLIDADLQQNPKFILQMVRTLEEHPEYDAVAAYQAKRHESKRNVFFKNTFYKLINKISDTDFVNGASDFRTFRKGVAESILSMPEYHRFSKGIFSWVGFNTYYMPYDADARLTGTSKWSFWKLFKYAIEGIVAFTTTPLRISSVVGMLFAILSIVYLVIVVIQKIALGIAVPGYATIVVLILLLGGLQLSALGIIGEYLARTYVQTKQRPIYVAREIISNCNGDVPLPDDKPNSRRND